MALEVGNDSQKDPNDTSALHDTSLHLADTDGDFPVHWKSGSLKYSDFKLMTEGGTAKLVSLNINQGVSACLSEPSMTLHQTQRFAPTGGWPLH